MSDAADSYQAFTLRMASRFQKGRYSRGTLVRAASYFWRRLTNEYKQQFKIAAEHKNRVEGRRGPFKICGFWHFATILETHMLNYEQCMFYHIWMNLLPENQRTWYEQGPKVVERECAKMVEEFDQMIV
jgi:hypothetical protein